MRVVRKKKKAENHKKVNGIYKVNNKIFEESWILCSDLGAF